MLSLPARLVVFALACFCFGMALWRESQEDPVGDSLSAIASAKRSVMRLEGTLVRSATGTVTALEVDLSYGLETASGEPVLIPLDLRAAWLDVPLEQATVAPPGTRATLVGYPRGDLRFEGVAGEGPHVFLGTLDEIKARASGWRRPIAVLCFAAAGVLLGGAAVRAVRARR